MPMGYVILFGWLILLPFCAGGLFRTVKNKNMSLSAQWLWGQFYLWAIFQVVAVYFILKEGTLTEVMRVYVIVSVCAAVSGLIATGKTAMDTGSLGRWSLRGLWTKGDKPDTNGGTMWKKEEIIPAVIFALLWLAQMLAIIFLAVNDGDDAYYMAIANVAESADTMYTANVYAFGNTELTYRYALAPFPIWIAFLSKISGVHTLVIGHVILGLILVTMSYVIYARTGRELFGENRCKRWMLLVFVAILYIWGNTSSHTAESFLLLRTRQGKALVAGLVFPAMICLIIKMGRCLEEQKKISAENYLLAMMIILTGCLGSTLGGSLVILLWGSALLLLAIGYRKWSLLWAGVLSAVPGIIFAILYLIR